MPPSKLSHPLLAIAVSCGALALSCTAGISAPASLSGQQIDDLKVLSDKIDDVTTVDNILKSFVKPGMSDAERSKAIWTAIVKYRHQDNPPNEYLAADWEAHDPVKIFNVYGYCQCCCASSMVEALNREDGREARGRIINAHSVPEVKYADNWHMFDCSLINYFPEPDTGDVASVDDITAAVRSWLDANPGYRGDGKKLMDLMRSDDWMGWKARGPALLASNPFYKLGWWAAGTHGWASTMQEYDTKSGVYDYGYEIGSRALFSLRPGESLVRDAGNRGLHVNMDQDPQWGETKIDKPTGQLAYLKTYMPGYNGGLIGNGYHRYAPDLASGGLAEGAQVYDNLASGGSPALHLKTGGKPGVAVIELSSPYIYLGGRLKLQSFRKSAADQVVVSLSTNNGRSFEPVWTPEKTGVSDATVDLKVRIYRRYSYWLKIQVNSASPTGAGLNLIFIENDIQHAPRTLPWLGKGSNTITVAADRDRTLATRSIACRIMPADSKFDKNETSSSMGITFDNMEIRDGNAWWKGGTGTMTVPVETPGDLVNLRYGAQIRARDAKDLIKILLSTDDGKTWKEISRISGPTPGFTEYFKYTDFSPGTKKALLRYELTGVNTVGIFSFRVDADYRDPLAPKTFHPFNVVHRWKENGQEKSHTEVIPKLPYTYKIQADAEPEMVSVSYEMPAR